MESHPSHFHRHEEYAAFSASQLTVEVLSKSSQRKKFLQGMPFPQGFQVTFLFGCHKASELRDLQVTPVSQGLPTINLVLLQVHPN